MLEDAEVVYRTYKPTIPPEVTYGLTERGQDLIVVLDQIEAIADQVVCTGTRGHCISTRKKRNGTSPHTFLIKSYVARTRLAAIALYTQGDRQL